MKNLILLKEITKFKKSGISLIEMLISSSLLIMIMSVLVVFFISINKIYFKDIKDKRSLSEIDEALYFIEYELERTPCEINIDGNSIILLFRDNKVKRIAMINKNLFILNSDNGQIPNDSGYKNYILKDIKEFKVKLEKNLFNVRLETIDGRSGERWYPLKEKVKKEL